MEEGQKRLVLIDGNAILHRAYHALPALTTRSGELVNAVYGFASMLLRIFDELHPEYIAVCFDTAAPNFRHVEYVGYKANRHMDNIRACLTPNMEVKLLQNLGTDAIIHIFNL